MYHVSLFTTIFFCMLLLLSGARFSNFALSRIKNPGCVAEFWAIVFVCIKTYCGKSTCYRFPRQTL